MQFGLRSLFIVVTLAALFCGCIAWVRSFYYVQVRRVDSVLAEFPEIDKVWLFTNDDLTLEVEGIWFSTLGQPRVIYEVKGATDGASKAEIRSLLKQALAKRHPVQLPARATRRLR